MYSKHIKGFHITGRC